MPGDGLASNQPTNQTDVVWPRPSEDLRGHLNDKNGIVEVEVLRGACREDLSMLLIGTEVVQGIVGDHPLPIKSMIIARKL